MSEGDLGRWLASPGEWTPKQYVSVKSLAQEWETTVPAIEDRELRNSLTGLQEVAAESCAIYERNNGVTPN